MSNKPKIRVSDFQFVHFSSSTLFCTSLLLLCILLKFVLEPLGGVKNLQVTDPTVNSLRVRWDPADGDVRQYNVIYVPAAGGTESMVNRT